MNDMFSFVKTDCGELVLAQAAWFANVSHLNLISGIGLFAMLGFAWLMSSNRWQVNWRMVAAGTLLQLVVAFVLFQSQSWTFAGRFPNGVLYWAMDSLFGEIKTWADQGAQFVFQFYPPAGDTTTNPLIMLTSFAFGVIPTVIFFAALMSVLYHFGIMQRVVQSMAWVMQKLLNTSGAESLAAAANVFVGHTEAPLVIRPYVVGMTRSELNALMVGGFATITGGLMALFVSFGVSAGHLVVASIISAPAALVIAKILQPETGEPQTRGVVRLDAKSEATNVVEAAANGASDGLKLALNIIGMLIAFVALVAMLDSMLAGVGNAIAWTINQIWTSSTPLELKWSMSGLFGVLFWPLAWLMGIEYRDCFTAGNLLGVKMVVNEVLAYSDLGTITQRMAAADFDPALEPSISERTKLILTYALCGFSNFGAIGIQLGGIGALAPERRSDIAQLGLRAMLGGMLACCCTACIAGLLDGIVS